MGQSFISCSTNVSSRTDFTVGYILQIASKKQDRFANGFIVKSIPFLSLKMILEMKIPTINTKGSAYV